MPRTAWEITVLPEPLSPTSATVRFSERRTTRRPRPPSGPRRRRTTPADRGWPAAAPTSGALEQGSDRDEPGRLAILQDTHQAVECRKCRLVHRQMVAEDADRLRIRARTSAARRRAASGKVSGRAFSRQTIKSRWVLTWRRPISGSAALRRPKAERARYPSAPSPPTSAGSIRFQGGTSTGANTPPKASTAGRDRRAVRGAIRPDRCCRRARPVWRSVERGSHARRRAEGPRRI